MESILKLGKGWIAAGLTIALGLALASTLVGVCAYRYVRQALMPHNMEKATQLFEGQKLLSILESTAISHQQYMLSQEEEHLRRTEELHATFRDGLDHLSSQAQNEVEASLLIEIRRTYREYFTAGEALLKSKEAGTALAVDFYPRQIHEALFARVEGALTKYVSYRQEAYAAQQSLVTDTSHRALTQLKIGIILGLVFALLSVLFIVRLIYAWRASELVIRKGDEDRRGIFDSVPAMIWYKDRNNRIIRCNQMAADTIGKSILEVEGHYTKEFYPEEADKYFADDLEVIQTGRPKLGIVEVYQMANGEKVWVQTDKLPFRDSKGKIQGVVVFSQDVSKLKNTEDQLQTALQVRDQFFMMASHELKTPLTTMKLALDCARMSFRRHGITIDEQMQKTFTVCQNQIFRLSKLIENMLDISKIARGKLDLEIKKTDVSEVIKTQVEQFREQFLQAHSELSYDIEPGIIMNCDEDRVMQVSANLITNALKYGAGSRVNVEVYRRNGNVYISVKDQGQGIGPEDQSRIFELFERAADERGPKGLGLGLYITKQIVEAHHGHVYLESEKGKGSKFTVELPEAAA